MKTRFLLTAPALSAILLATSASAVTLVEVDFSGTGGTAVGPSIPSSDSQFTVVNSAVTFGVPAVALNVVGGTSSTVAWTYDATGTAAANIDLFTSSNYGSPTRFDLDMGIAATGSSYTVTRVEVTLRALTSNAIWDFGYRKTSDTTTVLLGNVALTPQAGSSEPTTYFIDLTSESLTATDSASSWVNNGTGKFRFNFYETSGTGNDNLQIDSIRVIGTAVPEPSVIGLAALGSFALLRRRRSA